ncbi:MAG: DNA polymerase IV [Gammaproteobacteria bacterium]|nr:DNA polymerase IV [Gammaproteobacteria bacterium]MDH3369948.1 DNA polymerase IV [Gammaproteobacteria bacterium]MDH3405400.1 DNA polymerase IV [Gammaproteobacteria bacterium]MDH3562791.1 DNA polymerase IV [Gammaproteobacteria bacterium]MDH5486826.1 DNA polymerase IV [Gammaproteobacteria bacterium]
MAASTRLWPRAILHIDMNAFFASVEQRDFPELRGRPVGVTNGAVGTTLITCSYEARAFGVKTGMRVYEARRLCPGLIQRPARPKVYAAVSTRIMRALVDISPDVEVFSVDEAFIDVTHCQRLHGSPERIAHLARQRIFEISGGLPCSIGVAGNKSTAKIASDLKKPNGLTLIPPWAARSRLNDIPMEKLCGLGPHIAEFLSLYGARTCGDVARLPLTVLARRYGVTGKYLWLACQGRDTEPLLTEIAPPKSVGHGKVLPPHTAQAAVIEVYLRHMCEKVAARLRHHDMQAGRLYVGLRLEASGETIDQLFTLAHGTPDGKPLFELARKFLRRRWHGTAVTHVQVTALHLRSASGQLELFPAADTRRARRFGAIDRINLRYGEFTLAPATLLARSTMPNVIAPAWRPDGHRQHIPK